MSRPWTEWPMTALEASTLVLVATGVTTGMAGALFRELEYMIMTMAITTIAMTAINDLLISGRINIICCST